MKFKIGIILFFLILLLAFFGPLISSYSPHLIHLTEKNSPPSKKHWFGTDELGRDLFTRTCFGARISLLIGFSAAFIDLIIGVFFGGIAGYLGGNIEEIMMRIADILYAFPHLLATLVIMVILEPGILSMLVAMTFIGWITMARIVRGAVWQIKQQEYIQAASVLGASSSRILIKHIIPNCTGPIIVTATLTIPSAIFTEAFLSFLGLGIQVPNPSLGTMAYEGIAALAYYPWRIFAPATCISTTMLALNLIGDGLRDYFDPKSCY